MASLPLPTCLLLGALFAAFACGPAGPAPPALPSGTERLIWRSPDLPWPWSLEIEGRAVEEEILRGYLESEWADAAASRAGGLDPAVEVDNAALLRDFCADPEARFGALVEDVLLLREAEARFPRLDPAEVEAFEQEMGAAVGGPFEALRRKLGEEGLRRHVERRLRLVKVSELLAADAPAVTVDELAAEYQRVVDGLELPPGADGPSFAELEERLRRELTARRQDETVLAWQAARRAGVAARLVRPDGVVHDLSRP